MPGNTNPVTLCLIPDSLNPSKSELCTDVIHILDICKNALQAGISLLRGPIGEPGGDSLAGTF